jgi:hypothetical protein
LAAPAARSRARCVAAAAAAAAAAPRRRLTRAFPLAPGVAARHAQAWGARQSAATAALAELLVAQGARNVSAAQVAAVADALGVPADFFAEQKAEVYGAFLADLVGAAEVQVAELADLQRLRKALGLGWPQVGAQHLAESNALADGRTADALRRSDPATFARVQKLLFLTDCVLADQPARVLADAAQQAAAPPAPAGSALGALLLRLESRTDVRTLVGRTVREYRRALEPAARPSDERRALTVEALFASLALTPAEGRALCRARALPFYERALLTAIGRLNDGTSEQLDKVRKALQLDLSETAEAHREAFDAIVQRLVTGGRLDSDDTAMLKAIADTCAAARDTPDATLRCERQSLCHATCPSGSQASERGERVGSGREGGGRPERATSCARGLGRLAASGERARAQGHRHW